MVSLNSIAMIRPAIVAGCCCKVRAEHQPNKVLAAINYGWESVAFYTRWLHGDRMGAREIKQASLDPLNPQSSFAPTFLGLFRTVVLQEKAYIQRLQRHYAMFKQDLAQKPSVSSAQNR